MSECCDYCIEKQQAFPSRSLPFSSHLLIPPFHRTSWHYVHCRRLRPSTWCLRPSLSSRPTRYSHCYSVPGSCIETINCSYEQQHEPPTGRLHALPDSSDHLVCTESGLQMLVAAGMHTGTSTGNTTATHHPQSGNLHLSEVQQLL